MRYLLNLITIGLMIQWSCKSDKVNNKTLTSEPIHEAYMLNNQDKLSSNEINSMRSSATAILDKRIKENNNETFTILHGDIWVFGGLVSDSKSLFGDSLDGAWLDFKDDLTYEYGKCENKNGSGRYYYNFNTANLLMLDNNPAIKPQEFEVKMGTDMLVIVGNEIYKDNNMQAKLDRKPTLPTKTIPTETK